MSKYWQYMSLSLNQDDLPTMEELLEHIEQIASHGSTTPIDKLREEQYEKFHAELVWQYPMNTGTAAGGFITPVREGILWIPYEEIDRYDGEILLTNDAELLDEETCRLLRDDLRSYANELCNVLDQAITIIRKEG